MSLLLANLGTASAAQWQGVVIDDQVLAREQYGIFQEGDEVIVPLRPTAEAIGFTVTWDSAQNTIVLENQSVTTQLTIGQDSYYKQSSQALGLTQPVQLGYAPTLVEGRAYVPLKLYELLLGKAQVARTADGWITITTQEAAAQLPNPIVDYPSVEAAQKACGFTFKLPKLPEGYQIEAVSVINKDTVSIQYTKEGQTLTFRASQREEDISGVYTAYPKTGQLENAQVKGDADLTTLYAALLRCKGVTYSLYSEAGLTQSDMAGALQSLQKAK